MRALIASLALIAACRGSIDVAALERRDGVDGAAAALRLELAAHPDRARSWIALATVEARRGRPGAALAALERAERLGAPLVAGLRGDARAALAALLVARAEVRVARGSVGADADVARARALGATIAPSLAQAAALAAVGADLAHTDPSRRAAGLARLATVEPRLAAGFAAAATDAAVATTAAWLDAHGARRAAFDLMEPRAEIAAAAGRLPAWSRDDVTRWLRLRRWWLGTLTPLDLVTLDRARAAGADTCAYARGPRDPGCDVVEAAGSPAPAGPPWEPALVDAWQRDGWRTDDPDVAAAWMIVAARAVERGQLVAWAAAVRAHVEVDALVGRVTRVSWLPAALAAAQGGDGPPPALGDDAAPTATTPARAWPAVVAAAGCAAAPLTSGLVHVARAFAEDPALADRVAEDLAGSAVDLAEVAPAIGRAFTALGDPARARAWWQRGFDASPEEPALALGLAQAMAAAGDTPAALQLVTRAAAGSGDAAATMYQAARGFAAVDATLDALGLARQAIEQSASGDEGAAAALAIELLTRLGRTRNAAELAALVRTPRAGDLSAVAEEVDRAARLGDAGQARLQALACTEDFAAAAGALTILRAASPRR